LEAGARRPLPGEGWVAFASVLFFIVGVFNIIDGFVALVGDDHFSENDLFFGDLTLWGVILLAIGAVQLYTSVALYQDKTSGLVLGVALASLNLVAQLFFVSAFPIWSILIMAIDVLIIYGLTVYAGHFRGGQ
jgi:hypothetical protein